MTSVRGSRARIQSARMPTWFVTRGRLGSLCGPPTPGHHESFTRAHFQESGFQRPHPSCASRHTLHGSIARSGASSRDREFLHRRLSTISGDTLGIALCTSRSHHSHRAAQSSCINFKRKVRYRTNELDESFRRKTGGRAIRILTFWHLCSNDAEASFNTIVITRHSLHVVIRGNTAHLTPIVEKRRSTCTCFCRWSAQRSSDDRSRAVTASETDRSNGCSPFL